MLKGDVDLVNMANSKDLQKLKVVARGSVRKRERVGKVKRVGRERVGRERVKRERVKRESIKL